MQTKNNKSLPLISIIVPAKNSATNLGRLLSSCVNSEFRNFEVIINDDVTTTDDTKLIIKEYLNSLKIIYLQNNIMMAQGRFEGSKKASGDIFLHIDSDMELSPGLLTECADKIDGHGYDALTIPEESFGTTFWAKCKYIEKKCYEGVEQIESLRCLRATLYRSVGGHNIDMVFSEDKDLDIRVRKTGAKVGTTKEYIRHNEGELKLYQSLKKKLKYSATASVYAELHPVEYKWQINIFNRYILYAKNIKLIFSHPLLYVGMIIMKTAEFSFGAFGLIKNLFVKA